MTSISFKFQPSKLGTKEYWDSVYEEEIANFEEIGDEGEIWFGKESLDKMVEWVEKYISSNLKPSILEIGTGNGTLLFALMDAGYAPSCLLGIDYSEGSIQLARAIGKRRSGIDITFSRCDFLKEDPPLLPNAQTSSAAWDLILDKGTFDAMALTQKGEDDSSPVDGYPAHVSRLLKRGGHFLITSCNFTEEELQTIFVTPQSDLQWHSRIKYPTISFGGKSGSVCSSVAFQKQIL